MDLEETKRIIESKIEAEAVTKNVRSKIKSYIQEKQNLREGFKETFKPLIKSQDQIKESIDNQQNAMIKQLQENQLALSQGLDKNRLAITQGFVKMDDVKKWDLLQLPGYEAIDDDETGKYEDIDDKVIVQIKNKDLAKIKGSSSTFYGGDPEGISVVYLKQIAKELFDFDYDYDKDKNIITLVGKKKTENIAQFKFEDFDKGLNYREAKDILDEYKIRRLPSEYAHKSIEKIYNKLEKVKEYLNNIKLKLKDSALLKFNEKEGFEIALPKSGKPQPKTKELIEKHNILRRYAHNLTNLKIYKENIPSKTGSGILHFKNPLQLLDRLELLIGSILAGNNGVIQEFSQIVHLLN